MAADPHEYCRGVARQAETCTFANDILGELRRVGITEVSSTGLSTEQWIRHSKVFPVSDKTNGGFGGRAKVPTVNVT